MFALLALHTSLCLAAGELPRFNTLPEGATARFGSDRFTTLQPLEALEFVGDGKELQGWDGQTLHRWEFPSGRPLGRSSIPHTVNPGGRPFAYAAVSHRHAQVAWIRFREGKERLQVWDFGLKKLVLDCDVTLKDNNLDYAALAWSDDATKLLAVLSNKQVHVYDRHGKLVEKTHVLEGKGGFELPSGKRLHSGGRINGISIIRDGKPRIEITLELDKRALETGPRHGPRPKPTYLLTFTDPDSGKTESVKVAPDLVQPGYATLSKDGRHLALVDDSRVRIWDVATRRELAFAHALPTIGQMVVSPGGTHVQFQLDPIAHRGAPWHSINVETGRLRRLETPTPTDGITLGLGATGFAVGEDQFVGITGRSLDRWVLNTGRRLAGMRLPDVPRERDFEPGYDECLLREDGFGLIQFACLAKRDARGESVFKPTWRTWAPDLQEASLRPIPGCTWQRGAAALPQNRFLYFATPPAAPQSKDTEVQPGVTFKERGETQMYFGRLDRPDSHHAAVFSGQWGELRGVSRGGQLLLLVTSESTWIQSSRHSQSTWYDPAAQRHGLLEFHSGEPVVDGQKLSKLIAGRASHLSANGRYLLIGDENKLQLYEPYVLGKVVKEIPLPSTPRRFAVSKDGTRIACQLDDATLLICDGERLAHFVDEALVRERPKDLTPVVGDLASRPGPAYRAARLLAGSGEPGVAALRRAVDGRRPDAGQIAGWVRDLDSDDFATREKAESSLADWGAPVEKALRDALNADPSAEKRMRLRRLLARLAQSPYGNRELAQARAVLALEWNGGPAAAELLAEWAEKFPRSVLGKESKFALANRPGR